MPEIDYRRTEGDSGDTWTVRLEVDDPPGTKAPYNLSDALTVTMIVYSEDGTTPVSPAGGASASFAATPNADQFGHEGEVSVTFGDDLLAGEWWVKWVVTKNGGIVKTFPSRPRNRILVDKP